MHRNIFIVLVCIGFLVRAVFAWHQPFTNDEGAYLYDASAFLDGRLTGGDIIIKSPSTLILFGIGVVVSDASLFAARAVNIVFNLLTVIPLVYIASIYGGRREKIIVAALWLLGSGPIVFYSLGHTQALASFFAADSLALALLSARAFSKKKYLYIFLCGVTYALAFTTRKVELILLVPLAYVIWTHRKDISLKTFLSCFSLGVGAILMPWLLIVFSLCGVVGIEQALGFGYGGVIRDRLVGEESNLWWGSNFWSVLRVLVRVSGATLVAGLVALLWSGRSKTYVPVVWAASLIAFYLLWPGILPDYTADLFPALTLASAFMIASVYGRLPMAGKAIGVGGIILFAAWNLVSAYTHPWTGMFTASAIEEAADIAKKEIPLDVPMFTAAVIVPYRSGHQAFLDISHPFWYRYDFIPSHVKDTFLPPLSSVEKSLQNGEVQWVLNEHLTDHSYFRSPSNLISYIRKEWVVIDRIENNTGFRSNPLEILRRKEVKGL